MVGPVERKINGKMIEIWIGGRGRCIDRWLCFHWRIIHFDLVYWFLQGSK